MRFADPDVLNQVLAELLPENHRERSKREQLAAHRAELLRLVNPKDFRDEQKFSPTGNPETVKPINRLGIRICLSTGWHSKLPWWGI